jgi:hypothetical protein
MPVKVFILLGLDSFCLLKRQENQFLVQFWSQIRFRSQIHGRMGTKDRKVAFLSGSVLLGCQIADLVNYVTAFSDSRLIEDRHGTVIRNPVHS